MEEQGNTYLEDFLQSLENLPISFRRDSELMKELDRNIYEFNKEVEYVELQINKNARQINKLTSEAATATRMDDGDAKTELESVKIDTTKLMVERQSLIQKVNHKLAEKKSIALTMIESLTQYENKLDADLVVYEQDLKSSGEYEAPRGLPPNTEVAFKSSLDANDRTLVLGQVIQYRSEISSYEIIDVDDQQKYTLPDSQVLPLGQADLIKKLNKGDIIYALYPDTTLLYPSTVMQIPRRTGLAGETLLTVQFFDDEDAEGTTPTRNVPLKYVVRAPQFL